MEIRPMKMKDLIKVRDLELGCIKEYFSKILENKWDDFDDEWKAKLGASGKGSFQLYLESGLSFVAEEDGEIMGFIFAQCLHHVYNVENLVWIENMGVHPYYRRMGIGYKLLRQVAIAGKEMGCTVVHSAIQPDNLPSIMLHKKLGFFVDRREVALLDLDDLKVPKSYN